MVLVFNSLGAKKLSFSPIQKEKKEERKEMGSLFCFFLNMKETENLKIRKLRGFL